MDTMNACPDCRGNRLRVYKTTRKEKQGLVFRYRECAECGARHMTRERVVIVGTAFRIREGRQRPDAA